MSDQGLTCDVEGTERLEPSRDTELYPKAPCGPIRCRVQYHVIRMTGGEGLVRKLALFVGVGIYQGDGKVFFLCFLFACIMIFYYDVLLYTKGVAINQRTTPINFLN